MTDDTNSKADPNRQDFDPNEILTDLSAYVRVLGRGGSPEETNIFQRFFIVQEAMKVRGQQIKLENAYMMTPGEPGQEGMSPSDGKIRIPVEGPLTSALTGLPFDVDPDNAESRAKFREWREAQPQTEKKMAVAKVEPAEDGNTLVTFEMTPDQAAKCKQLFESGEPVIINGVTAKFVAIEAADTPPDKWSDPTLKKRGSNLRTDPSHDCPG